MNCSQRIRDLREDHDLSQANIANIIHVAQTTYSDYEHDRVRIPLEILIALAQFYDVDMNYITGVTNRMQSFPKS